MYTIEATAWYDETISNTKSYKITVYKPQSTTDVEVGPKKYTDVDGYIELTRHYYSHPYVVMDYRVSAHYIGDEDDIYDVGTEYKNTIVDFWGPGIDKPEPPAWRDQLGPTGSISKQNRYFPDSGSISNSLVGGANPNGEYSCKAYVRLTVSAFRGKEDYHFEPSQWFQLGQGAVE